MSDELDDGPAVSNPSSEGHLDGARSEDGQLSLVALLTLVLSQRHHIIRWAFGVSAIAVLFTLVQRPTFTSSASFVPLGSQSPDIGGLLAVAGQFGLSLPGDGGSESPQFYTELLQTRELLLGVLKETITVHRVRWGDSTVLQGTLLDLLEIEEESTVLREEEGVAWLRERAVSVGSSRETGVVTLTVRTPWPGASFYIARRLVELASTFNLETRQSQAAAERAFIERRLKDARSELELSEDSVRVFLERNRQFENSPQLRFEHERLQRQVNVRAQVYSTLSQSFESARISEVRDTPILATVEPPIVPPEADPRRLVLKGILGLLLGGMIGFLLGALQEWVMRSRLVDSNGFTTLAIAWRETRRDLLKVFRSR